VKKQDKNKLWTSSEKPDKLIEEFTIGNDQEIDIYLAEYDVLGSIAHVKMLHHVSLLSHDEMSNLCDELIKIYIDIKSGNFSIEEGVEDIHSQVELILTQRIGETGKRLHTGRSRNDQVLLDLRLFSRGEIEKIVKATRTLFETLLQLSDKYAAISMPGYTHTQAAMPSSFGLWFAAFAESLVDDVIQLKAAYDIINKNPLGSAAGYGSSFPLNRTVTTELLGFDNLNYNSIYAQMGRGRSERIVSQAIGSMAETVGRMANDIILFVSQNYDFISFPDSLTSGSSIMPHKKNPDVFELIRSKCNQIKNLPNEIMLIMSNLISGYHRDFQMIKSNYLSGLINVKECIEVLDFCIQKIQIRTDILEDENYLFLFTVEAVNGYVKNGMPFRDAYNKVAEEIKTGKFSRPEKLNHTHEGSKDNLCNKKINLLMDKIVGEFNFEKVEKALKDLRKR
jgi:argininosuccinate lyase